MNNYLLKRIKRISVKDIIEFSRFLFIIPCACVFSIYLKIVGKKHWIISEDMLGANDNGYVFFLYMLKKHPEIRSYYSISTKSNYYKTIEDTGYAIKWGSFRHWLYYLTADVIISTQIGASPYMHVTFPLEIAGILRNRRVFLQHGIIMNYYQSLDYKNNKLSLFICGARPEYEYISSQFHFPKGYVAYTGLARFDWLHNTKANKNTILIMPTWRYWFKYSDIDKEGNIPFIQTEYFLKFSSFINNRRLINYIEENNLTIFFYLHRSMQRYTNNFKSISSNVKILERFDRNIQELLQTGAMMVTDYSSISVDFAYMEKPVIYYQFDQKKFREEHGQPAYFSYEENGFGPVLTKENEVVDYIIYSHQKRFKLEDKYIKRIQSFFELRDTSNCERIYEKIICDLR